MIKCRTHAGSHRSWKAIAECGWPSFSVRGEGRWASWSNCREPRMMLWPTEEKAVEAVQFIDDIGCGGFCCRAHKVVDLKAP